MSSIRQFFYALTNARVKVICLMAKTWHPNLKKEDLKEYVCYRIDQEFGKNEV